MIVELEDIINMIYEALPEGDSIEYVELVSILEEIKANGYN